MVRPVKRPSVVLQVVSYVSSDLTSTHLPVYLCLTTPFIKVLRKFFALIAEFSDVRLETLECYNVL